MKFDKRRKYYLILDCETATLPFANEYSKDKIALQKPLIYDIGWRIVDRKGNVYKEVSYIVSEIFFNLGVFNTGYYCEKRPIYFNELQNDKMVVASWEHISRELENDLAQCESCGAYNSYFDFKKAIPFTEKFMVALYSNNLEEFYNKQRFSCECITKGTKSGYKSNYDNMHFIFRGKKYDLFDIWFMCCKNLINNDKYKDFCISNNYCNTYFKTSAEIVYRFFNGNDFVEQHRALQDAQIESELFAKSIQVSKEIELGVVAFPFRTLGTVKKYKEEMSV